MNFPPKPKYSGPGVWLSIHLMALHSRTKTQKRVAADLIKILVENFPCEKCREHGMKYIQKNPIGTYVENIIDVDSEGKDITLFKWTVDFHNQANKYTSKPNMSLEDAYLMYTKLKESGCTINENCDSESDS